MRELLTSDRPEAALAIDYFVYRAALAAGSLAAAMGGLDAFVFTAGIGENAPEIRARIAARLSWLGAELDAKANERGGPLISVPGSRVALYVVPTDEELMIAQHTLAVLTSRGQPDPSDGHRPGTARSNLVETRCFRPSHRSEREQGAARFAWSHKQGAPLRSPKFWSGCACVE
jgi:hypothetical protein